MNPMNITVGDNKLNTKDILNSTDVRKTQKVNLHFLEKINPVLNKYQQKLY